MASCGVERLHVATRQVRRVNLCPSYIPHLITSAGIGWVDAGFA